MPVSFETAKETVSAAATLACHGPQLLQAAPSTIQARCQEYWLASHERFQKWGAALRVHEAPYRLMHEDQQERLWLRLNGLFEEIMAAGIFARVWTAIGSDLGAEYEIDSFLQSAYLNQLEVRQRALKLILKDTINHRQSGELDKLRRRSERWTDLLLAHLAHLRPVKEYAFEIARVNDFAETLAMGEQREIASSLLLKSIQRPMGRNRQVKCPHPQLNQRVAESVLAALGPDTCDSTGKHTNLWQIRLLRTVNDTEQLIEQLSLENESPNPER